MIPKEKMDECVTRFTQNPYWRAYLDNAPESAKAYIRMTFVYSALSADDRHDKELRAEYDSLLKRLDETALRYLYEKDENQIARRLYKKMLYAKVATPDNGNGGGLKHITEGAMYSALEAFIGKPSKDERGNVVWSGGNEYWRDLFMEAPTGARLRLSLNFYFSENHEKPDFPMLEYRAIRKVVEDALDFDSLEYLIANEGNKAAKNHYKDIWKVRMGMKDDSDDEWKRLMRRASTVTSKAGVGMAYQRIKGKPFPIEKARSALWRGVWVSSAEYDAAPEWAKRYCEHHGWVKYVGKGELPDGKDGRKMDYAYICTKMEDADWDFLIKHTHSYARGMAIGMARRHYQHKDIRGNPIEG